MLDWRRYEGPHVPFTRRHMVLIREGLKTQTCRSGRQGIDTRLLTEGTRFLAYYSRDANMNAECRVVRASQKRLGDLDAADAQREGGYTLEEFRKVWRGLHRGRWNPEAWVFVLVWALVESQSGV